MNTERTSSRRSHVTPDLRTLSDLSEAEMVATVAACLRTTDASRLCEEVPILGRSADLVFEAGGLLVSMEFKRSNWRRAVIQAQDHLLATDFAYVCMPPRPLSPDFLAELNKVGVGLAIINPLSYRGFDVLLEASLSTCTWPPARRAVENYLAVHGEIVVEPTPDWTEVRRDERNAFAE